MIHPDRAHGCHPRFSSRRGLSLLEVILSLAILGGAIAVLGELIRIGSLHAATARDLNYAHLLCDTRMAEIASGALPAESSSATACEENEDWLCGVAVDSAAEEGMLIVTVTVEQSPQAAARPVSYSLVRWLPDPAYVEAEKQKAEQREAETLDAF